MQAIPTRVFWLLDALLLVVGFQCAYTLTEVSRPWRELAVAVVLGIAPSLGAPLRWQEGALAEASQLLWILVVMIPAVLLTMTAFGLYGAFRQMSIARIGLGAPIAVATGASLATLIVFALRLDYVSRLFLLNLGLVCSVLLVGSRLTLRSYQRRRARAGHYVRRVLFVASSDVLPDLVGAVSAVFSRQEYEYVGYLDPVAVRVPQLAAGHVGQVVGAGGRFFPVSASGPRPVGAEVPGLTQTRIDGATRYVGDEPLPCCGSVDDLEAILVRQTVQEIVLTIPPEDGGWVTRVLQACDRVGAPARIVPYALISHPLSNLRPAGDPRDAAAWSILLAPRVWNSDALQLKRLLDVFLSAALIALLAPLLAAIAALVKMTSRGPLFYRWTAIGMHGREFTCYKFRTMTADADVVKASLLAQNEMTGPVFKMRRDPRITPLGRILRKFSLDELPQLWPVLKGDMSLVGPRPPSRAEFDRYEVTQMRKVSVRPGITCLWQVSGRNRISDFSEWVRLDLEYIDSWSLWLDLKILAKTLVTVLRGTGV